MKLGVMQPYFFPYIGYWQLINAVDTFVIYDDVNFRKGGWINRNRILVNEREHMITLQLKKSSPNKLIKEIDINEKREKLIKTIFHAYRRAPHFGKTMPIVEEILQNPVANLALFLEFSIRKICDYIDIRSEIVTSSKLEKNNVLRAEDKLLDICQRLGADKYINSIGGRALYDPVKFNERGIELKFTHSLPIVYGQFYNSFIPSLSIIDVLMFNSLRRTQEYVNQYSLV